MAKYCWQKIFAALVCCAFAFANDGAAAQTITDEGRVPKTVWSGYYWPTVKQEILKPLAKYDNLTGASSVAWEKEYNPSVRDGKPVPSWWGLCHGFSAAALLEEEPTRPIAARRGDKREQLSVGDQKAWLSLAHGGDVANFYGRRFDGEPGDDRDDMAPEILWEALRTAIKEQKTGLVVDLEPGEAVWNFPVYAYRVSIWRADGNLYRGEIYLWLASDQVSPDFVGCKTLLQRYPFEIELTDAGAPIVGTGRWIGAAVGSHVDFAWTPYLVRSGNDELSYETACELLNRRPFEGPTPEIAANDDGNGEIANVVESETDEEASLDSLPTATSLDLEELLYAFKARGNDFMLDINVEGMQRQFNVGDELRFFGVSEKSGYLHLVAFTPDDELVWLYPRPGDDNRVEAKKDFTIPKADAPYSFVCVEPTGTTQVYAIVSERPIRFADADGEALVAKDGVKKALPLSSLTTKRSPSEKNVAEWLKARSDKEKAEIVEAVKANYGRFACDQESVNVVKKPQTPKKSKK